MSTKMSGFSMEVINSDPNMVICGIRVLLGNQDVAKTPAYVEVNIQRHGTHVCNLCIILRVFYRSLYLMKSSFNSTCSMTNNNNRMTEKILIVLALYRK